MKETSISGRYGKIFYKSLLKSILRQIFLILRLASSSVGRVQRLTSSAVLTGQRLLARTRLLSLAHRGLELGLTSLLFVAVSVFCYGSIYSSVIPTQVNKAL